jgi:nitroimidazol reductase NimA-like FMN-containing flavoprotein (pyridoxamine 5'-phosphate oxidase superfamily)
VEPHFRERLKGLFETQGLGVLSTCREGRPYSSLIGFVATADLKSIVFATLRHTRKYRNLTDNERISILIDSRTNRVDDFSDAVAVTAIGTARETGGTDREELAGLYLQRHFYLKDFVHDPNCAIIIMDVKRYILVSQFQQVFEMEIGR